ncbi:ciliary microtubule inner protein 1-like isoform X2 [Antedon mediterranea]|uniref:ciliary microtubule inner protein 1-like isoform X2 n=1 Tax=Antedon mediterranea TaxID=105859 RepID=UPI003AF7B657
MDKDNAMLNMSLAMKQVLFSPESNIMCLKDHIRYEIVASRKWPKEWGFLKTSYSDLVKDEITKTEREKIQLPAALTLPPITPISRYITVHPSPKPFPQTTSSEVGWRSSCPQHSLEKYGKYARPKGGLIKAFKWPPEAII